MRFFGFGANGKNKKRDLSLRTLIFCALIIYGALFIIYNQLALEISFYVLGGAIVLISLYMIIPLVKLYRKVSHPQLRQNFFIYIILLVMSLISGITVIINAGAGMSFYLSTLGSIFFFRSIHRFFTAYSYKMRKINKLALFYAILGGISLLLAGFLSFNIAPLWVTALVCGIALVLEGLLGLFLTYRLQIIRKFTTQTKIKYQNPETTSQKTYSPPNDGEIIITDYEIVEDNKEDN